MDSGRVVSAVERLDIAELLQQWAEREPVPRLLVDEQLAILWSNRPAHIQLTQRRDLEIREGRLAATNPAHQPALLAFVQSCGSGLESLAIACDDQDGHILFRCLEIASDMRTRYFGMIFYRSGSDFRVSYADLETVFSLTRSEHKVLLQLLEGHTADEIATLLNVSIETTRSHIRQIYAKLDVTSREGMFSRLRPYRLY
jgi:DNA-binding CsgD family transcriptional regulator